MAENEDPRIARSRRALLDALAELLELRDVQDISVTELVAAAGVSRPTFYQHFADVPALAAEAAAERIAETFARSDERFSTEARAEFVEGTVGEIVAEMDAHRTFYRRVLAGPSARAASDHIIRFVAERMRQRVYGADATPDEDDRIALVAAGIAWLVVQWVERDPVGRNDPATASHRLAGLILAFLPEGIGR